MAKTANAEAQVPEIRFRPPAEVYARVRTRERAIAERRLPDVRNGDVASGQDRRTAGGSELPHRVPGGGCTRGGSRTRAVTMQVHSRL
jgi:hypothetical protein